MIGSSTNFTSSRQRYHTFGALFSTNNYTSNLHPVIAALRVHQKIIYKLCGIIGHKADACTVHVPNFPPPSLIKYMKQSNSLNGDEPTDPPGYFNRKPPAVHFK